MFPKSMEFFVEEKIAERYAEAEKYRLGQDLSGQNVPTMKLKVAQTVHYLSRWMLRWSENILYPDSVSVAEEQTAV